MMLLLLSLAFSSPCLINRTDGMEVYGECFEYQGGIIFYSCAGFTCRVNPKLTEFSKDTSCPVARSEVFKKMEEDHKSRNLSEIKYCMFGE